MASLEHPTYPNPTVVEAVCQIDFDVPADSGWQIGRPAEFLKLISADYPNMEAIPLPGITISVGQTGFVPRIVKNSSALKLSADSRVRYMVVGDSNFAFGHVAPYSGWTAFRANFLDGWTKFVEVAKISRISRASLRYVNLIPRTKGHPLVSDWLEATETVPQNLIRSQSDPFTLRLESWVGRTTLLIVTVGTVATPNADQVPPILLDIQRTSTAGSDAKPDELFRQIDSLHDDVWNEFASLKTARLDAHLERRAK